MSGTPEVTTTLVNNKNGKTSPLDDGISAIIGTGVAVGGQFVLDDVLGPFTSPQDAVDKGIDAAYDTANTCMMYAHIADFYELAGLGTALFVMVVAKTVTMEQMCDKANSYAKKLLSSGITNGRIRMVSITRIPDAGYTPIYQNQVEVDLIDAFAKAQALANEEYTQHRPVQFFLEGRNFQANISTLEDLRSDVGVAANKVSAVIFQDKTTAELQAENNKYAAVCGVMGRKAAFSVQRNIGRVKSGPLPYKDLRLSDGATNIDDVSPTNKSALLNKGWISCQTHTGKSGYFYSGDPTAVETIDDFRSVARVATIHKATRISRAKFTNELLDDVELDADTGYMLPVVIKSFEEEIESEIGKQMIATGEISSIVAFIDPAQDVNTDEEFDCVLTVGGKGYLNKINVKLQLA